MVSHTAAAKVNDIGVRSGNQRIKLFLSGDAVYYMYFCFRLFS